ncbi:MAG TPA: serine/threonine-protein kinase [Bryobacteraceae bacterium]|nr:serine/threonine-protein kinase [Bryobacteraceae bacterium]
MSRIESLFHDARQIPAAERLDWLRVQCEGDADLYQDVMSLLQAHTAMTGASAEPAPDPQIPAANFGVYRASELIGHGGMSTVYLGRRVDGQFEQTVAIKVMAAYLGGREFLRRFETERRLLAALSHNNITRLFDGGVSSSGDPFLVTEYVDGRPIDKDCDERKLSVAARLRVFLQVCEAVDYAHRNLIVHRDLKPANILVNAEGVVKLLDFGTASLLAGQTEVTVTRMRMLTPRYASPEQLRGERVNISTDVFSLGIILYELLTGAWPFGNPSSVLSEISRATGDTQASPPSTVITEESAQSRSIPRQQLSKILRGDLSAIVLKALENDPARRYESVRAFATDLENYLEDLPVLARPQTALYRAGKFIRRRWVPVSVAAIFVLGLSGATIVALQQARLARREALKAQTTSKFLQDMLATDNSVDKNITLSAMVDRAEAKLNRARISDPLVEADLRLWLAQSFLSRQEFEKMHRELDRAEALFQASGRMDDLVKVESWRATGFDASGDRKTAKVHLDEVVRRCRVPGNHADPEICIESYVNLLITHVPDVTYDQQKQLVREAEGMLNAHPEIDPSLRANVLKGESRIAIRERRYADADRVLTEALRLDRDQPDPSDSAVAQDLFALADLRFRLGDVAGAAGYNRQRMVLFERASGPDASVTQHAVANLAWMLAYQGELVEARQLADAAVHKTEGALEYQRMIPLFAAAVVRNFAGQPKEAEPFAREAARISLKSYPRTTSVYAEHAGELGISLLLQGRAKEALPILQESDQVFAKLNIPTHPFTNRIHGYYLDASKSGK